MDIGYARVSSVGQTLDAQLEQLRAAGCAEDRIFIEKASGRSAKTRKALDDAIRFAREGDTLLVTRLDRLARSTSDLHQIVQRLDEAGVGFRVLSPSSVDTTTVDGRLVMSILGALAQFETEIAKERRMDGIAKARTESPEKYRGRRPTIDPELIRAALAQGEGPAAVAKRLGIARSSVYRVAADPEDLREIAAASHSDD